MLRLHGCGIITAVRQDWPHVQTSFLFYAITTYFSPTSPITSTYLMVHWVVRWWETAFIGFDQIPGGPSYIGLTKFCGWLVGLRIYDCFSRPASHGMARCSDGRDSRIIVYRDKRGTFTRSVTIAFVVVIIITFVIRGNTSLACHIMELASLCQSCNGLCGPQTYSRTLHRKKRAWEAPPLDLLSALRHCLHRSDCGQVEEGGWVVLITFSLL